MCRPLFVVDGAGRLAAASGEQRASAPFASLVAPIAGASCDAEGVVEFLDVDEVDKAMVAMSPSDLGVAAGAGVALPPRYTHCEIHPSMTLGVLGVNIPFSDHNQAPRVAYQCAMGKQAVGVYMSNYNERIDTMAHVLHYGQQPMARTRLAKHTFSDALPSGVNAIVAIMTYTGFNQEDSVMLNQSAVDRGMFASTYYKSYKDQCNKNHSTGEEEVFTRPEPDVTSHLKPYNYGKLGSDGFVPKNTAVDADDVLVGKVMPVKIHGEIQPRDASLFMKGGDEGVVDYNYVGTNADGYRFCKVRLRKYRKPTVGDKFSSRHAQKGSCGMVYRHQDMPFTKDGIVPDIIINPHAIPSRMTVGQLMECVMGKAGCCLGALGDATPFSGCSVGDLGAVLEANGMERHGNEIMYDGRSGAQIHTEIFIGPTFYQRLKHMVVDKMHCLTMDHEVLTRDGWKEFGHLSPQDEIAALVRGSAEFVRPTELHHYPDFAGDVFDVRNGELDLTVTAQHRMWVARSGDADDDCFELVRAEELVGQTVWYETGGGRRVAHTLTEAHRRRHAGGVFCVSVPSEVFLVRRNGVSAWTGNSRGSNGPVVFLTRQPAEGRARNGGLRFGEMERDAIVAHGASAFLKERMLDVSDNYRVFVCRKCGVMCTANPERNIYKCNSCKNNADIAQVRIPYSCKLMVHELMALGVVLRFVL
jgi:DNA-directed RNA polymerase beta subunit